MAGVLRKTMLYLGLVDGDEEYDDYPGEYPEDTAYVEAVQAQHPRRYAGESTSVRPVAADARGGVATIAEPRRVVEDVPAYTITTVHPRTYNEAKQIGELLRTGTPVIMNLTEMDDSDARRLVDFGAGLTFGLYGSIERVTNKVFLLSPSSITVSAEDKARIAEGGFFNQS